MMRLCVVYEDSKVWIEYKPEDFKKLLIDEFEKTKEVARAFDHVCLKLKQDILKT